MDVLDTCKEESDKGYEEHGDMKQRKSEPPENVTSSQTTKPESRKQTLRIRIRPHKQKKNQLDASSTQTQNITKSGPRHTKVNKIVKKPHNLKPSKKNEKSGVAAKKPKFTISSHGLLRKKKKKYNFKCPIKGCKKFFGTVKDWNLHHLSSHSAVKYQC